MSDSDDGPGAIFGSMFARDTDSDDDGVVAVRAGVTVAAAEGMRSPPGRRSSSNFVGLDNQGATCYMNSLLQCLYMTPELREAIYALSTDKLGIKHMEELEALELEAKEAEATAGAEAAAADSGGEDESPAARRQQRERALRRRCRVVPLELQRLFSRLQILDRRSIGTEELTERGFKWTGSQSSIQHDAAELNRKLYERVEKSLVKLPGEKLVGQLYSGVSGAAMQCMECRGSREARDPTYDVMVTVKGNPDLVSGLSQGVRKEVMAPPNAVFCEACDRKTTTLRGTRLHSLPGVLVVTANRYELDMSTFDTIKLKDRFEFPLVLDAGPFVNGGAVAVAQEELGAAKATLHAAAAAVGLDEDAIFALLVVAGRETRAQREACDEAVENAEGDSSLAAAIDAVAASTKRLREEEQAARASSVWISALDSEAGRQASEDLSQAHDALPEEGKRTIYDLFAVVIHHGSSPGSGHYTAKIRDCIGEGKWTAPATAFRLDGKGPGNVHKKRPQPKAGRQEGGSGGRAKPASKSSTGAAKAFPGMTDQQQAAVLQRAEEDGASPLRTIHNAVKSSPGGQTTIAAIRRAVASATGSSYGAAFEQDWGPLESFLLCCSKYMVCVEEEVMLMAGDEPPAVDSAPADDGRRSRDDAGSAAEAAASPHTRLQQELAAQWGNWFSFDDSTVSPATLADVASTFSGTNCAYLLMYRSRTLEQTAAESLRADAAMAAASTAGQEAAAAAKAPPSSSASSSAASPPTTSHGQSSPAPAKPGSLAPRVRQPVLPAYWSRRITKESEELARERKRYDEKSHQMRVWVHTPSMYEQTPDGLGLRRNGVDLRSLGEDGANPERVRSILSDAGIARLQGKGDADGEAAATASGAGQDGAPDEEEATEDQGGIPILVDTRRPAAEFCEAVLAASAMDAAAPRGLSDLRIHVVRPTVTGAHLYEPVPADTESNAPLLGSELFDALAAAPLEDVASTLSHEAVVMAWDGKSVAGLAVFPGSDGEAITVHVEHVQESKGGKSYDVTAFDITMARACSIHDFRSKAAAECPEIDAAGDALFLVAESSGGRRKAERIAPKGGAGAGAKDQSIAALGLYDGAKVIFEPSVTSKGGKKQNFFAFQIVRDRESSVRVSVTWTAGGLPKAAFSHACKAGFVAKAEDFEPPKRAVVGVDVTGGTSVAELKALVVSGLRVDVSKTGGGGRCKLITSTVGDESKTVSELGLRSSGLRIEPGPPLEADELTLQVGIVVGNKRTVRGGGGDASSWMEITVPGSAPLALLKQMALGKAVERGLDLGPFPSTAIVRTPPGTAGTDPAGAAAGTAAPAEGAGTGSDPDAAVPSVLPLAGGRGLKTDVAAADRRLRSTNGFGEAEPDGLYVDESKSVAAAGITHNSRLLLEEGCPPTPGYETVHFAIATPRFGAQILARLPPGSVPTESDLDLAEKSLLLANGVVAEAEADAVGAGKGDAAVLVAKQAGRAVVAAALADQRRAMQERAEEALLESAEHATLDASVEAGLDSGSGTDGGGEAAVDLPPPAPLMRVVSASGDGEGRLADASDHMLRVRYASVFPVGTLSVKLASTLDDLKERLAHWPELAAAHQWYESADSAHDPLASRFHVESVTSSSSAAAAAAAAAAATATTTATTTTTATAATASGLVGGTGGGDGASGCKTCSDFLDPTITLESLYPGTDWPSRLRITVYRRGQRSPAGPLVGDAKTLKTLHVNQGLLYVVDILPEDDPLRGRSQASAWLLHVQKRTPNRAALRELVRIRDERQADATAAAEAADKAGAKEAAAAAPAVRWSDPLDAETQAARCAAAAASETGLVSIAGVNTPIWPPEQLVFEFDASAAKAAGLVGVKGKPLLSVLLHQLAESDVTRPGTKPGDLRVARYNPSKKAWITLSETHSRQQAQQAGGGDRGGGKKGKKKGKGRGKVRTLRDVFGLNHGDLIAFSYAEEDKAGADDWMRAEDFCAAAQEAERLADARAARAIGHVRWGEGKAGKAQHSRPRRVERALSLGSEDSYVFEDDHTQDSDADDDEDRDADE